MEVDSLEKLFRELGDNCVACGCSVTSENYKVYNRGRNDHDDVLRNIDIMCDSCYEEIDNNKKQREFNKEVFEILSELEKENISNGNFWSEFIKRAN